MAQTSCLKPKLTHSDSRDNVNHVTSRIVSQQKDTNGTTQYTINAMNKYQ